jgi:fumarate hydratase class I
MSELPNSLLELIRRTSTEIPDDVHQAILNSLEQEKKGTIAENAMKIIDQNIALAKNKSQPICQDTGSILFYVDCPVGFDQITFAETAREAVKLATKKGFLRQNSVDSLTGKNDGNNCRSALRRFTSSASFLRKSACGLCSRAEVAKTSARNTRCREKPKANGISTAAGAIPTLCCRRSALRAGSRRCIGGDRARIRAEKTIPAADRNRNPELDALEQDIIKTANELGIGPMGFGGKTTLLGVKICAANRLPASYFVSISYMCWAYRRQGVTLDEAGKIGKWLY